METVILHACIDRRFIFRHTAWEVIEPVSWLAAMTDGPAEFERVLSELSPESVAAALACYIPNFVHCIQGSVTGVALATYPGK